MATVYIESEDIAHLRMYNDTGADLVQYEFTVIGEISGVADEAIASTATGSFHVEEGIVIQATNLVTAESTFATPNQAVYFNPADGKFSDTEIAGYYLVGQLTQVKNSAGLIKFTKFYNATLIVGT
jgi:hypothetical protein